MEIQLQELIDQIKKDGVETAEAQAASIVSDAEAQAEKILADAQAKAQKMIQDAKAENERYVRVSEDAIRQAGRNLLLSFRESVTKELQAIVGQTVSAAYSQDALKALVVTAVESFAREAEAGELAVLLNTGDLEKLEGALHAALKEKMLQGVTLRPSDDFDGGFRIEVGNGQAYYDYSASAVVQMLSEYLSPRVKQLMKEAQSL